MMAQRDQQSMSQEEYLELDRNSTDVRYEYVNGYARMLAGGTLNHATVSFNVARVLYSALSQSPRRVYTSDVKVKTSEGRIFYPDVSVSCDSRENGQADILLYPRVIVEVLSPSTEDFDRGRKFTYYRQLSSIQEYLIIDPQHPTVELFRREKQMLWTLHIFTLQDEIQLTSLDVRFPVSLVYEGVQLLNKE